MAGLIEERYREWEKQCDERFEKLKANEEELNRIFISLYGLDNELCSKVEDRDITVRRAEMQREIKSLISYAVGCMFGRYSVDEDGVVYAGGEWNESRYRTFRPVKDNIISVSAVQSDNDITALFIKWIGAVYGEETLEENLSFIAQALGGKGMPREIISDYFRTDFYRDHVKIYHKRPIYWMFSSGKKKGFMALVYLHRYDRGLVSRLREKYVSKQAELLLEAVESAEKEHRGRQSPRLREQEKEVREYYEKLRGFEDYDINLDDGVKLNYSKFEDILEKIR